MNQLNSKDITLNLQTQGYAILPEVFSSLEIHSIAELIDQIDPSHPGCRRTIDFFAIRQFLKLIPAIQPLVFKPSLVNLIKQTFGPDYLVVKSIYFDKPPSSNWFVAWHQDLTISVDQKHDLPGYGPWTTKGPYFSVQPPLPILENMFTIRVHLDDTDETNGALRVLPGSHLDGISRYSLTNPQTEVACRVPAGGAMLMRPLLQHASSRSTAGKRRRVIHIELSNAELPRGLNWAEPLDLHNFAN